MPLYLFTLESRLTADNLIARLRPLVREPAIPNPPIRLRLGEPAPTASEAPFVGSVDLDSFLVRRSFTGRSSLAPFVFGRVASHAGGSRLRVRVFVHPSAFPLVLWLGAVVGGMWRFPKDRKGGYVMIVLCATLFLGGFVWEARLARRLLEAAVSTPAASVVADQGKAGSVH